jgi:transcriptional regulator with PAS, ATPase and Fis domain
VRTDPFREGVPLIVSASNAMHNVLVLADRVAAGDAKVLITGESGVGKDLVARYIHAKSRRASREFVAVNCAAVPDSLLESELFGHVRGSFTGAYRDRVGKLELAHGGTIFLDEVGEMSGRMQVLLLRFLENGEIQAVGAERPRARVDARVICATNRNLFEMVASSTFREDLLYRIQVAHLHVPPLRHRREDIAPLIQHTLERTGKTLRLTDDAMHALEGYRWPGNVRELQNVIEQLAWLTPSAVVDVDDLPPATRAVGPTGLQVRERRRQLADDLYQELVSRNFSFWNQIYHLFLNRDITRHDIRELVRKGLATTCGNYKALVKLFGMPDSDYKRFLNFIAAHDCKVSVRSFRNGQAGEPRRAIPLAAGAACQPVRGGDSGSSAP